MGDPRSPAKGALERRAAAIGVIVAAAFGAAYLVLVARSADVLTGDELFFYTIGLSFRKGHLLALDKSPPLFAAMLAALPTSDVRAMRGVNALLSAADVGLLFLLARRVFDARVALVGALLLGASKFWVQYGVQLYAEPLFVLLVLGAFLSVVGAEAGPSSARRAGLTGVLLGLAIMAKPVGSVALAYLALVVLARDRRASGRVSRRAVLHVATMVLVALVVASPALALGELRFVRDYTADDSARRSALVALAPHLTLPAVLSYAASLGLLLGSPSRRASLTATQWSVVIFPVAWLAAMLAPPAYHFARHAYPALPLFFVTCALPLAAPPLGLRTNLGRAMLGLGAAFAFASNARRLPGLPHYSPNVYYLAPPPGCVGVGEWRSVERGAVTPPVFDQPVDSVASYVGVFEVPDPTWYRYLFLSFVDDLLLSLEIDGEPVAFVGHGDFAPTLVRLPPGTLHPGRPTHELLLSIRNGATMGGFGQVLFCARMPPFRGEGGVPEAELF